MELRKLKSFLVVAKQLHFGKAAEKLNITQPALTHQINQLESDLGYELFNKSKRVNNRKVELTEAGIYLMKEISRVIDLLDRTLENAKTKSEKNKQIKLAIPRLCNINEVVNLIKKLHEICPETTFNIVEFATGTAVQEALFKGNVEIGITTLPIAFKGLDYQLINSEVLNVLLQKQHPLAKYHQIKIEQLRNDKWIELNNDLRPAVFDQIEVFCRNVGFSREANIVQEVSNMELLVGLVNAGIGIAIFPSPFSKHTDEIVSKKLVFSDDTQLEITKVLAFKETLENEYLQTIKDSW